MNFDVRSLSNNEESDATDFTTGQNNTILIIGLACACFSLATTFLTLRWFILMKRTFRHQLIFFLICSDTFKAVWYFVFPIVVLSRGPVSGNSAFCQASGFLLALGIEASDFAILAIAVHAIIFIFRPPPKTGQAGGIYPYRKWIFALWVGLPVLSASLAFINDTDAYTTSGTYCYLPRRPFWYRLALSWIPRYLILLTIFGLFAAVYIYVTIKFRSFSALQVGSSVGSDSRRSSIHTIDDVAPDEIVSPTETIRSPPSGRPTMSRLGLHGQDAAPIPPRDPWDEVSFITSKPLYTTKQNIDTMDFATNMAPSAEPSSMPESSLPPTRNGSRKPSTAPTTASSYTGETLTPPPNHANASIPVEKHHFSGIRHVRKPAKDPLEMTRTIIRRQLRYMFLYPVIYILFWIFPFASHCTLYNDHYVRHPVYWLTILSTASLALQAAADCFVFSFLETPWRRIPEDSKYTIQHIRHSFSLAFEPTSRSAKNSIVRSPENGIADMSSHQAGPTSNSVTSDVLPPRASGANWWEVEGRARKDSVWMGTDTELSTIISASSNPSSMYPASPPLQTMREEESRFRESDDLEGGQGGSIFRTIPYK